MVRTRVGRAGAVRVQRERARMPRRLERVRRGAAPRARLCCTDGVGSSLRARRETLRAPPSPGAPGRPRCRAPGVKRGVPRRVVDVERRLVEGTPVRGATRRRRAPGDGVLNTADSERRHAPCRARLASLTHRGRGRARRMLPVQHGRSLLGTVETVGTPHARLVPTRGATTPALAAGSTTHGWTVQALRSFPVPPSRWTPPKQRGRRSGAVQRRMARWCAS